MNIKSIVVLLFVVDSFTICWNPLEDINEHNLLNVASVVLKSPTTSYCTEIYLYNKRLTLHVYRNFYFAWYCDTICIKVLKKVTINVRSLFDSKENKLNWWNYLLNSEFNGLFITGCVGNDLQIILKQNCYRPAVRACRFVAEWVARSLWNL